MKALVSAILLLLWIVGYSESARAQEEIRIRPIDGYLSGFGGYSFSFKTDFSFPGLTLRDVELDNNPFLRCEAWDVDHSSSKNLGDRCRS